MTADEFGFVFVLLEEGAPLMEILERIIERQHADATFATRLVARAWAYRRHCREDAHIPETIVDDDGSYARQRSLARAVLPRLDRLILSLARIGTDSDG